MAQKIRVGAVSYLNTKPLIYGFEQGNMKDEIDLIYDYPANIAALLIQDKIDIGLVPVAIIPLLPAHQIVADYGIACDGEVASVCLFSDVPLQEIETILMDYQSRTSVALLQILLKEHWKINPALIAAKADYENEIAGTTAGLVIGDRAFVQRQKSKYIYDLGTAWKALTGLPFVFATWVGNKKLPADFIAAFNEANAIGLNNLDEVIGQNTNPDFDMQAYYTQNIQFYLKPAMHTALKLFLSKLERDVKTIP